MAKFKAENMSLSSGDYAKSQTISGLYNILSQRAQGDENGENSNIAEPSQNHVDSACSHSAESSCSGKCSDCNDDSNGDENGASTKNKISEIASGLIQTNSLDPSVPSNKEELEKSITKVIKRTTVQGRDSED